MLGGLGAPVLIDIKPMEVFVAPILVKARRPWARRAWAGSHANE